MIIKAALHTLRHGEVATPLRLDAVADIDEEVSRLNRIVNEVLDFARPIQFELAPVDVNQLCRACASAAQAGPGAAIDLDLDPALPAITSDGERLRGALVNLLVNARQAAETGAAPTQSVHLETRHVDRHVSIRIVDRGAGIEPADVPRVFDPYFTTKRGGTGLGLPIAKNIVEGLGGTIALASEPAGGTTILIHLPVDMRAAAPGAPSSRSDA
jgi:two-component system sensor histidine kinase HydH